jgi:O-antigen/teichoic acid export membrane protein
MLLLGLIGASLGFLWASQLIKLLFGNQYEGSISIFRILIWLLPIQFIRYKYTTAFRSTGYQKYQIPPFAISTITLLFFVIVFPFKLENVAAAVVLSEAVLVFSLILLSRFTYA